MKKGWEIKEFERCLEKVVYTNKIQRKDFCESGDYPIISQEQEFINGYWNNSDDLFRIKKPVVLFGDHTQVVKYVDFDFVLGADGVKIFQTNKEIEPRYFYYYLQNVNLESLGYARHYRLLKELKIKFPNSIPEQQQIVSILDETFTAIDQAKENLQRNLQNAKELFQSELNNIFTRKEEGWAEKKLEDVALVFGRGKSKHRPRNDEKLYGGNYPFIQTGDVRNSDKFITQYSQTYNEIGLAQSKLWQKGTICITIAANIAETGILTFDSCFPDSMIGLVVDPKKAEVNFAYYALQFLKSALQLLGKGSAQDNINMGTFESQKFPFPSLEMQKKIVDQLDTLSFQTKTIENIYQKKLDNLEELKKSILQKAFSGELSNPERALSANDGYSPSKKKNTSSIKSPERA